MEGRRIRMKEAAATTLALTGGYLLMEADYEGKLEGRRLGSSPRRRRFFCPQVPLVSTVSMLLRTICVLMVELNAESTFR
jgi:hypothetical protein